MRIDELDGALEQLDQANLLRVPDHGEERDALRIQWGDDFVEAASNDYLGLGAVSRETDAQPEEPLAPEPLGAGASRLIFGTHATHTAVETFVADWLGYPAGLLFSSGYSANVGALSCLLSEGDVVISDRLNHASIIDGIRLSRSRPHVVPHLDLAAIEQALDNTNTRGGRWVVVESYYSMEGDCPDLPALRALCDRFDAALYVDEAHGLGVFGPEGRGVLAEQQVQADVVVAAFGKAVGSQGACVLGSPTLRTWLWNRARSFTFSTAPSPHHAATLLAQLKRTRAAEAARRGLAERCARVRARLETTGVRLVPGRGPIVGVWAGPADRALAWGVRLRDRGIVCQAIRPPTVPEGQSRIRCTIHADWSARQEERFCDALAAITASLTDD